MSFEDLGSSTYTDVELRILGSKPRAGGGPSSYPVEVRVGGSGLWKSEAQFNFDSLDPTDPVGYGKALGSQLASGNVLRALDQAGLTSGKRIRLRLLLDDDVDAPHWIRWERLWLHTAGADWRLAASPTVAFSRYIPVQSADQAPPASDCFRLLVAVSNPTGLPPEKEINVESEISALLGEFERGPLDRRLQVSLLTGRTSISPSLVSRLTAQGWKLHDGKTTVDKISDILQSNIHGLHIVAHGDFNPADGVGSLLLESPTGGQNVVKDTELQSWVTTRLQLIVFQACLSAGTPPEGSPLFTGLAPKLIRLGVPASIAMQDFVRMDDARAFFSVFYRALLEDGLVDVAVNRGRQRLVNDALADNWSIPALFSSLRTGRLWRPDPVRESVLRTFEKLPEEAADAGPSLDVIEQKKGIQSYNPVQGAIGPRFDLSKRLSELAQPPRSFTVLTGAQGTSKAAQIRQFFREYAKDFLSSKPGSPVPVLVSLAELSGQAPSLVWDELQRAWKGDVDPRSLGREFLFLINGEEDLPGPQRDDAIQAMIRLQSVPDARTILVADELLLPALVEDFTHATLLIVQPLTPIRVSSYLSKLQKSRTPGADRLRIAIEKRRYSDLASQPLMLRQMLTLAARDLDLRSRGQVLEYVADTYLRRMDTRRIPRSCVERAAQNTAWQIQCGNGVSLGPEDFYTILNSARGGRESSLLDLMNTLTEECRLLLPTSDEGVRFASPSMQCYFAARHIVGSPNQAALTEDIVIQLGTLSRLRRWEGVLVLLAGMLESPADLLSTVLAGSSLMEGEQLFLAARCCQEALGGNDHSDNLGGTVDQLIDSLLWRSSFDLNRPYDDRRKALECLVELSSRYKPRQVGAVRHLVSLACDPWALPKETESIQFDWTGIRLRAGLGLMSLYDQTKLYVEANRPELSGALEAWYRDDAESARTVLLRDDPSVSVLGAFALGLSNHEANHRTLAETYESVQSTEVKWGIAEALGGLEASWLQTNVIQPWIPKGESERATDPGRFGPPEMRASQTCYLIERSKFASQEAYAFLDRCLRDGSPALQGRSLRAFAKLRDSEVDEWVRPLCEKIILCETNGIDSNVMEVSETRLQEPRLQRAALEALRDVGDTASLEVLRKARSSYTEQDLRRLSFQVAEEIYWQSKYGDR